MKVPPSAFPKEFCGASPLDMDSEEYLNKVFTPQGFFPVDVAKRGRNRSIRIGPNLLSRATSITVRRVFTIWPRMPPNVVAVRSVLGLITRNASKNPLGPRVGMIRWDLKRRNVSVANLKEFDQQS